MSLVINNSNFFFTNSVRIGKFQFRDAGKFEEEVFLGTTFLDGGVFCIIIITLLLLGLLFVLFPVVVLLLYHNRVRRRP